MPLTVWSWSEPDDRVLWSVPGSGLSRPAHEHSEYPKHNENGQENEKDNKKMATECTSGREIFLYLNNKNSLS